MRLVPLLIVLVTCSLSVSVAPDLSTATVVPTAIVVPSDAGDAQYQALQRQADLALDALRQSQERRLDAAQLVAN